MLLALPTKPCILITSMHKTFKTFLFFTRKKKQKNLTSATSAKGRSEEQTSELQSRFDLVCRLLLDKKNLILDPIVGDPPHEHVVPVVPAHSMAFAPLSPLVLPSSALFVVHVCVPDHDLLSFPTRRSSDLANKTLHTDYQYAQNL